MQQFLLILLLIMTAIDGKLLSFNCLANQANVSLMRCSLKQFSTKYGIMVVHSLQSSTQWSMLLQAFTLRWFVCFNLHIVQTLSHVQVDICEHFFNELVAIWQSL